MFSSRTNWNVSLNRLYSLTDEKRSHGESITDLTISNPTICSFSYPAEKILSALADESAMTYRPEPRGSISARESIAGYYANRGISINPDRIVLTSSTSEAYSFLFKLLCNANDRILAPLPSYPLFEYLCQMNDIVLDNYNLIYDGEWHTDFASLESKINDNTRAIILIHPNNPTGSYLKQEEFDRICDIANLHRCALIVDEVFESFALAQVQNRVKVLAHQKPILLFSLNGISKLMGLPQLKLSWIIVHGNMGQVSDALNRLDIIADTFLSVNIPVQNALPELFKYSIGIKDQITNRVRTNYAQVGEITAGTSLSLMKAEGGWNAILQLPNRYNDQDWAEHILESRNILVQPGFFFDIIQKSCIVVSLLPESRTFKSAIEQICQFVEDLR